jgi:hypothetical protein
MAVPFEDQNHLHWLVLLLSVLLVVIVLEPEPAAAAPLESQSRCILKPKSAGRPPLKDPNCRTALNRDTMITEPRSREPARSPLVDPRSVGNSDFGGTDSTGTSMRGGWSTGLHIMIVVLLLAATVRCDSLKDFAVLLA